MAIDKDKILSQMSSERSAVEEATKALYPSNLIANTVSIGGGGTVSIEVDSTLSYTSENPVQNKVITSALSQKAESSAIPTKTSQLINDSNFITTVTGTDVTNALGYTPYNSLNPSGYQENVLETVKVNGTAVTNVDKTVDISIPAAQTVGDGDMVIQRNSTVVGTFKANQTTASTINISVPTTASDIGALPDTTTIGDGKMVIQKNGSALGTFSANQTIASTINVTITSSDVTNALGYTPYSNANPSGYQANVIETITINGTAITPTGKTVDITVDSPGTVGNGDMVIQRNSTAVGTFTANQTTASTINISVPTTASDVGALPDNTPIPSVDQTYSASSTNAQSGTAVAQALTTKSATTFKNWNGTPDVRVQDLVINKLTKSQYDTIIPSTTELYFLTDAGAITSEEIISALGYTPYSSSNPADYQTNVIETIKVNGTALTPTTKTVNITLPAQQTVGDGAMVIKRNNTAVGTFTANQTAASTISISVPTSASDIGALPDTTTIGAADFVITRNNTAVGTIGVNATANGTINISVPTTASDVGALPDSTTIGAGNLVIQRNSTALGTFGANQTTATTINVSVPTTASDVGALPDTTTIPVVYNANMVIQRNSTAIGTFTANQSAASTINISVPTTASDVGALPDSTTIGNGNMVIQRNNTAIGTFTANQTSASTINISVPTSAADVGALPDSTVIGAGNITIKRNGTAVGTINANTTVNSAIDITVPTTASDVGALPDTTTIPVVYNTNMVIQRNNTAIGTFTANQSAASTINISVPTTASDIGALPDTTTIPVVYDANMVIQKNGIAVGTFTANQSAASTINVTITSSDVTGALGYTPYSSSNPADYQTNVIETIQVNGTALTPTTKTVDITIPAQPTVGNANMVIQRNNTAIGTFTANQTAASTINVSVPTTAADVGALPDTTTIGAGNTTIKRNGTAIGTIGANQTANASIDITVPDTTTAISSGGTAALTSGGAYSGLITSVAAGNAGEIVVTKAGVNTTIPVGSSITIDTSMSTSSTNPVQNKVITSALENRTVATFTNITAATSADVTKLKVNRLTAAEYATITPSDTELYFVTDAEVGVSWGDITGTLSSQTDLQTALNAKYDTSNPSGYQANVVETIKVNGTALTPTTKTVNITIPAQQTVGNANMVIQRNNTAVGTFTANQTSASTINISVPTQASDIGALPDTTTIGSGNLVIQRNSAAIGTFGANQTTASTINISVPTTAADVGALPDSTTIPTVYNANMVIQRNSTAVGTFTANQSAASTINISVPTTAADVGALPDTTTIPVVYDSSMVIQRNNTAVGTFTANQSAASTINISVPTTAADVGALPDSTTIPTVYDSKMVIRRNGSAVGTFTANQSTASTINISVPTDATEIGALPDYYTTEQPITSINNGGILIDGSSPIYKLVVSSNAITFVFSTHTIILSSSRAYTFELIVDMQTVQTLTFPSNVTWQDSITPDMTVTGIYMFAFRTIDAGTTWLGNLQGVW